MKQQFIISTLFLLASCANNQQPTKQIITDGLIVGKWKMVEYAGGNVNALDTISFLRVVINVLTNLKRFHRPVSSSLSI